MRISTLKAVVVVVVVVAVAVAAVLVAIAAAASDVLLGQLSITPSLVEGMVV